MPTVTLNRDGLALDGRPFYLLSGVIHYFRWPRAEWRDVLLKAKAAGINTVDTVIPWNLHEPEPGRYYFADEADLPAYLDLCHELGLFATVRPGPYICAEWENGGFPAWLEGRGPVLRSEDPATLAATASWFDVLLPHIVARQATRGGPVILVQIENEHWSSGVYGHDGYQATLARMLRERGVEVPLYTCVGAMPGVAEFSNGWSGMADRLRSVRARWPKNPLIVSELWSGWFDNWGASAHSHKSPAALDRALHELAAAGMSGVSHWMWAGGTNFAWWGGRTLGSDTVHMTASYDYDAPLDEYGAPTAKYYVARRHHLFLGTLGATVARLLAGAQRGGPSVLAPPGIAGRAPGGDEPYYVGRNGAFSVAYLQNTALERQTMQVFQADPAVHLAVDVEATSLKPVYGNLPLPDGCVLRYHTGRILGYWPGVLVCYGFRGELGELELRGPRAWEVHDAANAEVTAAGDVLTVRYWITERPVVVRTNALTLVLVTQERAERWWPLGDGSFLCGPDLVLADGRVSEKGARPFYRLGPAGALAAEERPGAPRFDLVWETLSVAELTADLSTWREIPGPMSLEELECALDYGWYAVEFDLPEGQDAEHTLAAPWLSDRARVFVDGEPAGVLGVGPGGPRWTVPLRLAPGSHQLRLLADELGRFNFGANVGERKGLLAGLYWDGVQTDITRGWAALWQEAAFAGEAMAAVKPRHVRADAEDVDLSAFAFQGPHLWLLREIEAAAGERVVVQVNHDRNSGAFYVNGRAVERFSRHGSGGYLKHDITAHLRAGVNVLALHVENYAGQAWRATLLRYRPEQAVRGTWRFRRGVTPGAGEPRVGPRFYRARFAYDPARHGAGPFRLDLAGLRKGHLWINGRDLARYWQIGPQELYKLPASWLREDNELLVFEEEDGRPLAGPQMDTDERR